MADDATPSGDHPSRRALLGGAAATAAAAWVVPSILSVDAAQAATAPPDTVLPAFRFYQSESTSGTDSVIVSLLNLNSPGLLVGIVAFRGGGNAVTGTPSGWTLAGSVSDQDADGALFVYWKVRTAATETLTVTLASTATNLGAQLLFYENGASIEPTGPVTYASGTSSTVDAGTITTLGNNRVVLFFAGWLTSTGSLAPTGFTNRGNVTNGQNSMTVADQSVPSPTTVGPTSDSLGGATQWGAGQLAIIGSPV